MKEKILRRELIRNRTPKTKAKGLLLQCNQSLKLKTLQLKLPLSFVFALAKQNSFSTPFSTFLSKKISKTNSLDSYVRQS